MASPEAIYDSLYVIRRLEEPLHGVTAGEVHLLSYLSLLLGVFRGSPTAEWGYGFASTDSAVPYSRELTDALDELQYSGQLVVLADDAAGPFECTAEGNELAAVLDELELFRSRRQCLEAACSSASAFPVAGIRQGIRSEPTLKSATRHAGAQALLAGPSLELLYDQFEALRQALGEQPTDLLVPSSVWLTYLIEKTSELPT